jgi:hypothetical protein
MNLRTGGLIELSWKEISLYLYTLIALLIYTLVLSSVVSFGETP